MRTDRWPILEPSQIFALRWLRKHIPRFGELPKQDQCRLLIPSLFRAFLRPGPLVIIAIAVPTVWLDTLFPDRASIAFAGWWFLGLFEGWCLVAAVNHEVRKDIRQKLSKSVSDRS